MRSILLLTTILASAALAPIAPAQTFPWRTDYEKAKKEAKASGKPLMLYFTTEWCGWCKVMEKETFTDKKVIEQGARYIPVMLDAEKEGATLAKLHMVDSYPVFIFTKTNGDVLGELAGFRNAADFQKRVVQVLDGKNERARIDAVLKKNPSDGAALCDLAVLQLGEGEHAKAKENIDKAKKAGFKGQELANALSELGHFMALIAQYPKSIEYLEESLALKDPNSTSVTYDRLIFAFLYQENHEGLRAVSKRIVESPFTSPKQKENAALGLRLGEYAEQLKTIENVIDRFSEQMSPMPEGKRDNFYFESLFMSDAPFNVVSAGKNGRGMKFVTDFKTYHKTFGTDKYAKKFAILKKDVRQDGHIANVRLETRTDSVGNDQKEYVSHQVIYLTMILQGDRWYISSYHMQTLANQ